MSITASITARSPEYIRVGRLSMWADGFKASAVKTVNEEVLMTGRSVFTNTAPRAMKIIFTGRFCNERSPLSFVKTANEMLREGTLFDVAYCGLLFKDCRMQAFTAEDSGKDYLNISLTLLTAESVSGDE